MRTLAFCLIAILVSGVPAAAQVRADPGVVIGNRVAVRVNVTLADDETPYHPVRGLSLTFSRKVASVADTVFGRTDEAGVVTVLLQPGDYVVASPAPVSWKGAWYGWSVPVVVRPDMPAVDLNRRNARIDPSGARVAANAARPSGGAANANGAGSTDASSGGAVRWLSIEVGGEGGLTRLGLGTGSDAGYGGAGAFVGGIGPVAVALGYRYTRLRYGGDLNPGSMSGATGELRYHLRPGSAPIRPYIGAVAAVGHWDGNDAPNEDLDMRMFGGTVGAQFGLATSVRLHFAVTAAGTNIESSPKSSGLFTTAHLGLTFDIFSPAR
ncbi:MAG TPA: hypothetical protein VFZ21_14555 [Gemmatimonadaceae bacterium]|jgi:hypothetical protein|nr:hypothetical protein [Gemmatimonadaceae bacterium]